MVYKLIIIKCVNECFLGIILNLFHIQAKEELNIPGLPLEFDSITLNLNPLNTQVIKFTEIVENSRYEFNKYFLSK